MIKEITKIEYTLMYAILNKLYEENIINFDDWYNALINIMKASGTPYAPHK